MSHHVTQKCVKYYLNDLLRRLLQFQVKIEKQGRNVRFEVDDLGISLDDAGPIDVNDLQKDDLFLGEWILR